MKNGTVIIADDDPLILLIMKNLIEDLYEVVAMCEDGAQLVKQAITLAPDVIVTDLNMPILNGLEAAGQIKKNLPLTKIIIHTANGNITSLNIARHNGASGYVLKSDATFELLQAIDCVIDGEEYFSETLRKTLDELESTGGAQKRATLSELTPRQLEILRLMGKGFGNKEIAHILHLSVNTVDFHRSRMISRFHAQSINELILLAAEAGLIRHPELWNTLCSHHKLYRVNGWPRLTGDEQPVTKEEKMAEVTLRVQATRDKRRKLHEYIQQTVWYRTRYHEINTSSSGA